MLAYGSTTDCRLVLANEDTEDCEVMLEYSYIVTNTIPIPKIVDTLV